MRVSQYPTSINEDSMNNFLTTILALSGLGELLVGAWTLLVPRSFARLVLGSELTGPEMRILIFFAGLATLGLAALHATAIRWLRMEKQEGYHLSIALGGALTLLGAASFGYMRFGDLRFEGAILGQWSSLSILFIDGVRGAFIGMVGFLAMREPSTVRELRLPSQSDRSRGRRQRSSARVSRDGRSRRTREEGRTRSADGDRRRRLTGSGTGGRSTRSRRESGGGRSGSPDRPRRDSRRERTPAASREAVAGSGQDTGSRRTRRSSTRGGGAAEPRERRTRLSRVSPPPETEDARNLGVVVTGNPLSGKPDAVRKDGQETRSGTDRSTVSDRHQMPRTPMVPRLRTEAESRSDGHERDADDENRENGSGDRPSRRRRRRPEPRETHERRPVVSDSDESQEGARRPSRRRESPPSGNRYVERSEQKESRDAGRSRSREDRPEGDATPAPPKASFVPPEPIDRISAFGSDSTEENTRQESAAMFGRHRRPFTPHRRGRQVKPRESKVHQVLGGDPKQENGSTDPVPADEAPRADGKGDRGIGPIDNERGEDRAED